MTDSVIDFYDRLSPEYRDNMGWDWEATMRREGASLDRFLTSVMAREGPYSLLDCTCGIGTQAIGLALQGHQVHASDLSPVSVERARQEAEGFGLSIGTCVADFRDLGASISDLFDGVMSPATTPSLTVLATTTLGPLLPA